jgi:hypothetical protein
MPQPSAPQPTPPGDETGLPEWARKKRPIGPIKRPTWVVVLAMAMMIFGGHLLMGALTTLHTLQATQRPTAEVVAGVERSLAGDLRAVSLVLDNSNPVAVRANVASKMVMALLLLFAVAAVWASDPRGRAVVLFAAWAGIVYHLADAVFLYVVLRKGFIAAAPMLVNLASQNGVAEPPTVDELVAFANTLTAVLSLMTLVVGVAFSTVLLAYFGGRKGRLFYGIERPVHVHVHDGR